MSPWDEEVTESCMMFRCEVPGQPAQDLQSIVNSLKAAGDPIFPSFPYRRNFATFERCEARLQFVHVVFSSR